MNDNLRRRVVYSLLVTCFCGCTQKETPPPESKAPDEQQTETHTPVAKAPTREMQALKDVTGSPQPEPAPIPADAPAKMSPEPAKPAPSDAKSPLQAQAAHADFGGAFTPGHVFQEKNGEQTMRQVKLASLIVTSEKLVAADPATIQFEEERVPLDRKIQPGRYPVTLALAKLASGDELCACARVEFKDAPAVRWEMATRTGEKLEEGDKFPFGGDSGQACLADSEAINSIDDPGAYEQMFFDGLLPQISKRREIGEPTWGEVAVGDTGTNLISFEYGDSGFACYWGFDEAGNVVQLVLDFGRVPDRGR
jgi:hypothetical protein